MRFEGMEGGRQRKWPRSDLRCESLPAADTALKLLEEHSHGNWREELPFMWFLIDSNSDLFSLCVCVCEGVFVSSLCMKPIPNCQEQKHFFFYSTVSCPKYLNFWGFPGIFRP